jgi:uncharacterized protein YjbI with pentapeptide repeats/DNA-binding XRE family transcriptional regulator
MEPKMIGGKIAQARKKMSFSQAQLAERLFISPQAVGKWERGESVPDIVMIDKLSKILEVDLNYFSEASGPEGSAPVSVEAPAEPSVEAPTPGLTGRPNWDMSRGDWLNADFSGLKGLHEKFSSSNMKNCKFIGSDLSDLLLKGNNIEGCDFTGADITGSHIQRCNVSNDVFKDCSLIGAEFSQSNIERCDLSGADLTGTLIRSCALEKNTVTHAVLDRTRFHGSSIDNTVFEGTVKDCYFEDCSYSKVVFRNSTLLNTFFKGPGLKRIKFIDCQADRLTYEFLKSGKADLAGITLIGS